MDRFLDICLYDLLIIITDILTAKYAKLLIIFLKIISYLYFLQSRGEERDREDAISFASRASRKSLVSGGVPSRKSATSHNKKGGSKPPTTSSSHHHHHLRTSSIGSASNLKRSMLGVSTRTDKIVNSLARNKQFYGKNVF